MWKILEKPCKSTPLILIYCTYYSFIENYPPAIFEAATLSDSDDVVASYHRGYRGRGQATPTANWTVFKLVFCVLLVIIIALMKTAAWLSKL